MTIYLRFAFLFLLTVALSACGGGGGGGGGSSGANIPDGTWLTFNPPTSEVNVYEGDSEPVTIIATSSRKFAANFNVAIIDRSGVITTEVQTVQSSQLEYKSTLHTASTLTPGTHTTVLEVRLCEDDPLTCQKPFPGSPWSLPLKVNVKSSINLTALKTVDGLGSWSTYQGNAAHTGFVAASFDPAVFSRRWKIPGLYSAFAAYSSMAVDGARAFFVRIATNNRWELVAVSEDTGAVEWIADMGTVLTVNPPAAANGRVYLTSTGNDPYDLHDDTFHDTFLWVYDQATGARLKRLPMLSENERYSAPTVFGSDVYTVSGYGGGMSKYSDQNGIFSWHGSAPGKGWSAATDGRFAYTFSARNATLMALDAASGAKAFSIEAPFSNNISTALPVVLTDTQQAIVVADKLMAFDLTTHTLSWILSTPATAAPVYGNGTIYVCNPIGATLEARAPATGNLLWSSPDLCGLYSTIIVTRNLAFISSDRGSTLAIDLATHKVVWTYPQGGKLAISARGVLYIFNDQGALVAVNLR